MGARVNLDTQRVDHWRIGLPESRVNGVNRRLVDQREVGFDRFLVSVYHNRRIRSRSRPATF